MELIICMIVIALVAIVSEFRILRHEKQKAILRARVADREWSMDEMQKLITEVMDDYDAMQYILIDHFGASEYTTMVEKKKQELKLEEELEAEEIMYGEDC